jgi:hypothetical protein
MGRNILGTLHPGTLRPRDAPSDFFKGPKIQGGKIQGHNAMVPVPLTQCCRAGGAATFYWSRRRSRSFWPGSGAGYVNSYKKCYKNPKFCILKFELNFYLSNFGIDCPFRKMGMFCHKSGRDAKS